jgi:hypothetical protein
LNVSKKESSVADRKYYLAADFTKEQKRAILAHCNRHGISVSKFLGQVAVDDAYRAGTQTHDEVREITFTIKLPAEKYAKLLMFSQRQDKSIDGVLQDLLLTYLDRKQPFSNLKVESLRYYLSQDEHEFVQQSLNGRGLASRSYVAHLALNAIREEISKAATGTSDRSAIYTKA